MVQLLVAKSYGIVLQFLDRRFYVGFRWPLFCRDRSHDPLHTNSLVSVVLDPIDRSRVPVGYLSPDPIAEVEKRENAVTPSLINHIHYLS
jgi:hypothetical protein